MTKSKLVGRYFKCNNEIIQIISWGNRDISDNSIYTHNAYTCKSIFPSKYEFRILRYQLKYWTEISKDEVMVEML